MAPKSLEPRAIGIETLTLVGAQPQSHVVGVSGDLSSVPPDLNDTQAQQHDQLAGYIRAGPGLPNSRNAPHSMKENSVASATEKCDNCLRFDHRYAECNLPCLQCGLRLSDPDHTPVLGDNRCPKAFWCTTRPGHTARGCPTPCRTCEHTKTDGWQERHTMNQCAHWCPVHLERYNPIGPNDLRMHDSCITDAKINIGECIECGLHDQHWLQDCPALLKRTCMRLDCREIDCKLHCLDCGWHLGQAVFEGIPLKLNNSNQYTDIVKVFHENIHSKLRCVKMKVRSGNMPWAIIECRQHPEQQHAVEDFLDAIRQKTMQRLWERTEQPNFQYTSPIQFLDLFKLPECYKCWGFKGFNPPKMGLMICSLFKSPFSNGRQPIR